MAKSSQVMNKPINPSIVKVTLPSHIIPGGVDIEITPSVSFELGQENNNTMDCL
jgi:hypothetical protein